MGRAFYFLIFVIVTKHFFSKNHLHVFMSEYNVSTKTVLVKLIPFLALTCRSTI